MKFVKKAEGKEMVPNVNFWMESPIYVKVSVLFVTMAALKGAVVVIMVALKSHYKRRYEVLHTMHCFK